MTTWTEQSKSGTISELWSSTYEPWSASEQPWLNDNTIGGISWSNLTKS